MQAKNITTRVSQEILDLLKATEKNGLPRRATVEIGVKLAANLSPESLTALNTIATVQRCSIGELVQRFIDTNVNKIAAMAPTLEVNA